MSAKQIIQDHIDDIVNETNPMFYEANGGADRTQYIESNRDSLYDSLEYEFEEVRRLNDELRSSASTQIEDLEDKISALESERDVYESDANRLQDENNELEARIQELEDQLSRAVAVA